MLQWYNVAFKLCSVQIGHLVQELEVRILTSNKKLGGLNILFHFEKGRKADNFSSFNFITIFRYIRALYIYLCPLFDLQQLCRNS